MNESPSWEKLLFLDQASQRSSEWNEPVRASSNTPVNLESSMESLISGSECAIPSNPLSQVLKHTESDRSLQKDRVGGPSSSRLRQLPSNEPVPANPTDLAAARRFFDPAFQSLTTSAFQRHILPLPHESLESSQHDPRFAGLRQSDIDSSSWTLSGNISLSPAGSKWTDEFSYIQSPSIGSSIVQQTNDSRQAGPYPASEYIPISRTFFQPSGPSHVQQSSTAWDQEFSRAEGKGKGRATDAEFDAAFARAAASVASESNRIIEVQDDTESLEAAFERTRVTDTSEDSKNEDDSEYLSDFQKVWDRLRSSDLPPPEDDLAKWEAEFSQVMQAQREDLDFGEDIQNAWHHGLGNFEDDNQPMKFDEDGMPLLDPYEFEMNNPYLAEKTPHLYLARAKQLLEQNGSLTEAALLLEAAIQQGDLGEGGYEAWILLGEARSMDEREDAGMRALTEGVKQAQDVDNTGAGMLSLAISYTNESFDRASHTILHRWLNARFPLLVPEELRSPLPSSPWASHSHATDAFLAVARQQHSQGDMDPDVQIGLGVLFYGNGDFEKAKDCFQSALVARPKDYLLWNRLGSCLSNGSRPEEALGVYREALQLRPTYTRAIYNVGVACLNIGAFKEAAEHFLSALQMQDSTADKSHQLWQTLRKCFLSMDRQDLADKAKPGEALDQFRREGFDF